MKNKKLIFILIILVLGATVLFFGLKPKSQNIPATQFENAEKQQSSYQYDNKLSLSLPEGWLAANIETGIMLYGPDTIKFAAETLKKPAAELTANELELEQFFPDVNIDITSNINRKSLEEFATYYLNGKYVSYPIIDELNIDGRRAVLYSTKVPRDVPGGYLEGRKITIDNKISFVTIDSVIDYENIVLEIAKSIKFLE